MRFATFAQAMSGMRSGGEQDEEHGPRVLRELLADVEKCGHEPGSGPVGILVVAGEAAADRGHRCPCASRDASFRFAEDVEDGEGAGFWWI